MLKRREIQVLRRVVQTFMRNVRANETTRAAIERWRTCYPPPSARWLSVRATASLRVGRLPNVQSSLSGLMVMVP
jgi:hypothetical protein